MQDPQQTLVQTRFLEFLTEFQLPDETSNQMVRYYIREAEQMHANERTTMFINFQHLATSASYSELAVILITDYYRFEGVLKKALQEFMYKITGESQENKMYFISFFKLPSVEKIRDLKSSRIGKLISFTGTITRSSEVRPELIMGTFNCLMCGKKISNVEQQFKYSEPKKCTNLKCDNRSRWELDQQLSVFCDFQKLRVQEDPKEIPAGSMPRSMDVVLRNEIVDSAKPGDKCVFVGCLIVVPDVYAITKPGDKAVMTNRGEAIRKESSLPLEGVMGLKQLGVRDLNYRLVFLCNFVEVNTNRFEIVNQGDDEEERDDEDAEESQKIIKKFTDTELVEIDYMRKKQGNELYKNLAASICPAVNGHEEIKKGVLLMLCGGVNKRTKEGINLRGDINACIVGDPSTAKSQFLKFVCSLLPRTVYTSGKASSAAGLTASVHKDHENSEFCIEAGALMLADNGICCIDEFDKMDTKDQVAIHEAMEQQTISIAKAGIHATLNARASILAAANPIFGRYDKSKSLKFNLNISAPIMSRFDLFFVVVDRCDEIIDLKIADHIVKLHREMDQAITPPFTAEDLRKYIRYARTFKPRLTQDAAQALKEAYIRLRCNDQTAQKTSYRITVRQLESLIRISEAIARVNCNDKIYPAYVFEAERLLSQSILQIEKPDVQMEEFEDNAMHIEPNNIISEELRQRELEERRKRGKVQLGQDEYQHISKSIIFHFQDAEKSKLDRGEPFEGIVQQDVVDWYIEQNMELVDGEEAGQNLGKITHTVINYMIKQEKLLVIVQDHPEYKQRVLALHANYMPDY